MVENGFAFNSPAVTVVEIDDPTSASAGIELLDQDAVQLKSMPLRVTRVIVRLENATVVFHSTNARVRSRTRVNKNLIAYVTFGPRAKGSVNGLALRPGLMLAVEPNAEATFVTDEGWESIALLVPPQDIGAHLTARRRDSEFRMPNGVETLQANAERVRTLFDWGKRLVETAARQPAIFNEGESERLAVQVELLETLLAALGSSSDFEPTRKDRTRQTHSLIVKIAEDHALSRIDDRLYVTDLCRAARVSERTLEYAFREIMGLTPVNYLIRLRLHRVRRELLAATRRSTTVTAEALKAGFWHFGEFSRAYKECFGELPSDTLRGRAAE
jgi:AraC-like DNA-binding protein